MCMSKGFKIEQLYNIRVFTWCFLYNRWLPVMYSVKFAVVVYSCYIRNIFTECYNHPVYICLWFFFSYIFDRMFYNDSSLPRTLKPPKYFEIKVSRLSELVCNIDHGFLQLLLTWFYCGFHSSICSLYLKLTHACIRPVGVKVFYV
jgi:hypothetical protein